VRFFNGIQQLSFSGETVLMSAPATPKSFISEQKSQTNLDHQWFHGVMTRWKMAEEFVRFFDAELIPANHPLRQLVGKDVPQLVGELARFRPDLF
jgi:hypothetical protein